MRPTPTRSARTAALCALAALVAACAHDSTAPRDTRPLDVSALLAEMTLPGLSAVAPTTLAGAPVGLPTAFTASNCGYAAASQSFVCPTVTSGGLTVATTYTLYDAAGTPQPQPDRATTAAVRLVTTAAGTVALPATSGASGSLTVDQRQDLTLGGLLAGTHTLNGTTVTKVNGTVTAAGVAQPLGIDLTTTITNLVLPPAGAAARWPSAGTIALRGTTTFGDEPATPIRAELVFNGTSKVAVTVTTGGVTERCTVDLAGQAPPVCSG